MNKWKMNNKGMTLVELLLSFTILGILLVIAAQIIHSSTDVYYYTKTTSNGSQAAQIVATEIRGEIEDAIPLSLIGETTPGDKKYIKMSEDSICFISSNGMQIKYSLDADNKMLTRQSFRAYEANSLSLDTSITEAQYNTDENGSYRSTNIGMGYAVKNISFMKFPDYLQSKNESVSDEVINYPVIVMTIEVGNEKFGDYTCMEFIPLYNFYGINDPDNGIKIYDMIE